MGRGKPSNASAVERSEALRQPGYIQWALINVGAAAWTKRHADSGKWDRVGMSPTQSSGKAMSRMPTREFERCWRGRAQQGARSALADSARPVRDAALDHPRPAVLARLSQFACAPHGCPDIRPYQSPQA